MARFAHCRSELFLVNSIVFFLNVNTTPQFKSVHSTRTKVSSPAMTANNNEKISNKIIASFIVFKLRREHLLKENPPLFFNDISKVRNAKTRFEILPNWTALFPNEDFQNARIAPRLARNFTIKAKSLLPTPYLNQFRKFSKSQLDR